MTPQEQSEQVRAIEEYLIEKMGYIRGGLSTAEHAERILALLAPPVTQPAANGERAMQAAKELDTWEFTPTVDVMAEIIQRHCFPAPATATEQEGAKLKYVRHEFMARMDAELIANERKGDWDAFRPKRFDTCAWMTEHTNKLWDALREHNRVKVSEFCADIANIAMKIDVTFGAKQEDIDAARHTATPPVSNKEGNE